MLDQAENSGQILLKDSLEVFPLKAPSVTILAEVDISRRLDRVQLNRESQGYSIIQHEVVAVVHNRTV